MLEEELLAWCKTQVEDFDVATIAITSVTPHGTSGAQWSLTLRIVPIPAEDPSQSDTPATTDPDGRQRGEVDREPEQPGAEAPSERTPAPAGRDAESRRHAAAV